MRRLTCNIAMFNLENYYFYKEKDCGINKLFDFYIRHLDIYPIVTDIEEY